MFDIPCLQDVAGLLQEFKATDILVGVISRSRCPRLTVSFCIIICVGKFGGFGFYIYIFNSCRKSVWGSSETSPVFLRLV